METTDYNPDDTRAEVFTAEDGFRFRLIDKANGEVVSQSEGYVRWVDAWSTAVGIVGDEDVKDAEA